MQHQFTTAYVAVSQHYIVLSSCKYHYYYKYEYNIINNKL